GPMPYSSTNPRVDTPPAPAQPHQPTIYATILTSPGVQELAITYFFHYPRNQWANIHESDWEGITVFLHLSSSAWVPDRVAFSQHEKTPASNGGIIVPWAQVQT